MTEDEIIKQIAFNIKIERMRKNLTQFQLAEIMEVHEKYIGKIESGKQNITIRTLIKLSKALNVSIEQLVRTEQ